MAARNTPRNISIEMMGKIPMPSIACKTFLYIENSFALYLPSFFPLPSSFPGEGK
jgi:hypothetical protein